MKCETPNRCLFSSWAHAGLYTPITNTFLGSFRWRNYVKMYHHCGRASDKCYILMHFTSSSEPRPNILASFIFAHVINDSNSLFLSCKVRIKAASEPSFKFLPSFNVAISVFLFSSIFRLFLLQRCIRNFRSQAFGRPRNLASVSLGFEVKLQWPLVIAQTVRILSKLRITFSLPFTRILLSPCLALFAL